MAEAGETDTEAPGFGVTAAAVGANLLQLQATASDPEQQPGWVNRRVEQLAFLDTRAVRWQISTDFMVPPTAPTVRRGSQVFRLVPITSLAKINLIAFNLRDEKSDAVCMPTSQETNHYLVSALAYWASEDLKISPRALPLALLKDLEWVVSAEPREFSSRPSALLSAAEMIDANRSYRRASRNFEKAWKELESIPLRQFWRRYAQWCRVDWYGREVAKAAHVRREASQKCLVTAEDIRPVAYRLMLSANFRSRIEELAKNFVVHVGLTDPPETRRIIKLAYESEVTFGRPKGRTRRLLQSLGWRCWPVDLLIGGRGGSHHLEVAAPAGVDVVGITADALKAPQPVHEILWWRRLLTRVRALTTKAWWYQALAWCRRLIFWEPIAEVAVPGYLPHVHINPRNAACVRYRATLFVRVSRPGWLTASWLVALVIGVVIVAGALNLPAVYSRGTAAEASTAATLLLALLGVFAVVLTRPGEHPLASRLLLLARFLIVVDTAVVLMGVGNLVLHRSPHAPVRLWTGLAVAAAIITILFTISWQAPVARQPHRE
jgi:hypothetical protein